LSDLERCVRHRVLVRNLAKSVTAPASSVKKLGRFLRRKRRTVASLVRTICDWFETARLSPSDCAWKTVSDSRPRNAARSSAAAAAVQKRPSFLREIRQTSARGRISAFDRRLVHKVEHRRVFAAEAAPSRIPTRTPHKLAAAHTANPFDSRANVLASG
jgi:hypothetical protein